MCCTYLLLRVFSRAGESLPRQPTSLYTYSIYARPRFQLFALARSASQDSSVSDPYYQATNVKYTTPYSTFNDDQSRQVLPVTSFPGLVTLTDRYRAPLGYQQRYMHLFASTHHPRRPPLLLLRTLAPTPSLKDSLLSPGENLSSIESVLVASHLHQFSCLHHLGSP